MFIANVNSCSVCVQATKCFKCLKFFFILTENKKIKPIDRQAKVNRMKSRMNSEEEEEKTMKLRSRNTSTTAKLFKTVANRGNCRRHS